MRWKDKKHQIYPKAHNKKHENHRNIYNMSLLVGRKSGKNVVAIISMRIGFQSLLQQA